uniref:N-acetyltransferase 6-like isoform X2 n=1 Tax=Crassostrea virginica TaxID=6565 RepID=A0A8B8E1T1_CRAVI|nr:N-acetyltransferase 6-like isoform X2 [Crassostrea virginica]XP_022333755.1 N-acetyltransferase 6-like isoform X2 [Crassostrea virginica]
MEEVLVLHKYPKYLDECADILNEEWKRSKSARLHSLEKSSDTFPTCLILVGNTNGAKTVIAHSRLSKVHGKTGSCLVESVVVRKELRGKGYGKKIMLETEEFAKRKGMTTLYLSTHDKQDFYKHLGFTFCDPIVSFGVNTDNLPEGFLQRFLSDKSPEEKRKQKLSPAVNLGSPTVPAPSAPPPPPPPPPTAKIDRWDPNAISWMKKDF